MNLKNFKSLEELYFSYYLEELKEAGYIKSWRYEISKFQLTEPYIRTYLKQLKTKIVEKEEFLLHGSSITADFTILWTEKAKNIFYLDNYYAIKDIKSIPFRLGELGIKTSYIEIKPTNESKTSSSISFPYKQKFCLNEYGIYIQKIKPFDSKKKCLFSDTFTPNDVIKSQIYLKDCKYGKKGDSKIKYEIKTLNEFIKNKK